MRRCSVRAKIYALNFSPPSSKSRFEERWNNSLESFGIESDSYAMKNSRKGGIYTRLDTKVISFVRFSASIMGTEEGGLDGIRVDLQ